MPSLVPQHSTSERRTKPNFDICPISRNDTATQGWPACNKIESVQRDFAVGSLDVKQDTIP